GAVFGMLATTGLRSSFLMGTFGVIGLCIGAYLAFGKADWRLGARMPTGIRRLLGAPSIGFLSVLMGIGGGSFGVPLMSLYGVPIHRAVATAAGFGLTIAVPAVAGFLLADIPARGSPPFMLGEVNLAAFAIIVAMTLVTAPLGVRLAHSMDPAPLRRVFAAFIALMALNMLRKALIG
ncbi:MAG: sulfite exporter TauE/SafE family protein, partial [Paracoccaceae bacterium]